MAEKKKNDDRVEVYVERGLSTEPPMLFVSVNFKNYLLPRGKRSMVPAAVAEELARSQRARIAFDDMSDSLKGNGAPDKQ